VFSVNAAILSLAVLLLLLTPVTVNREPTNNQILVLLVGLTGMLVANAWLLRYSLAPLRRLTELMSIVDVLEPGRRLDATATAEVAAVIATFNSTLDRLEGERKASMRRVLTAQESERRRIAQELHDQVGQNLTAVVLELRRVRERIGAEEGDALADAQELARESLDDLRRISYELRPAALDDLGLASALAALCSGIGRRTGIDIGFEARGEPPRLDPRVELAVYRVAQEALTNAVRHAQCARVDVELGDGEGGSLVLRIHDDGVGMAGGFPGGGIRGMRERALTIGATLELRSPAGEGVDVRLRVPGAGVRQA
jgi:two-component system sensor histidine kinase UhpB